MTSSSSTPAVTLSQLRTFLAVVDTGSVRAAALALTVSESAVSAAISGLGRGVGTALLERRGRGVVLAPAGTAFAPYARTVLGLVAEGTAAARGGDDPSSGSIRIAAVTTAAEQVVPEPLAAFRSRYPAVDVRLQVSDSRGVWAAFTAHEVDVVLAGRPPDGTADAVVRGLRDNRLLVVGAPGLAVADLGACTWLLREVGSGTRDTLEGLLRAAELHPPLLLMGSSGAVVAGAVAGLGLTLVSEDAVRDHLRTGALREVPGLTREPLLRPWHAVTHRAPTATTRLFVTALVGGQSPAFRVPRRRSPAASTLRGR